VQAFLSGSKHEYLRESLRQSQITNDYLMSIWLQGQREHPNPILRHGKKFFSQADEDGILLEILRRLGLASGTCVEIGCGNGTENNTLNLLLRGWPCVWVDTGSLAFDSECNKELLSFHRVFVNAENIGEVVTRGLRELGVSSVTVLSIDVDGNDGYLAQSLLHTGARPAVIVIETNELVPPPIRFAQEYDPGHIWDRSKNSGWSLQSLADLLSAFDYKCVACNLETGVNAFFVRNDQISSFSDIPRDLSTLYVGRSIHPQKYRNQRTQVSSELVGALVRQAKRTSPGTAD
jgi:hypothetical protein